MIWLEERDIRTLHTSLVAEHGGLPSEARRGALESALAAAPEARKANPDMSLAAIAAIYAWTFARNQVFADGNLRLALAAALLFLGVNGQQFDADQYEVVSLIRELQRGQLSLTAFETWLTEKVAAGPTH
jgi:death-on-curing protein